MQASELKVNDVIAVAGYEVALVQVERIVEDETWIYATDINDNGYEWQETDDVEILENNADPYDYIDNCDHCKRPKHLCTCP